MKTLIVIDMQNDFIYGVLGTSEAQAIVRPMKEFIKNFKGTVFFTQDTHDRNYLISNEGKHLPIKHCIKNAYGWCIPEELLKASVYYKDCIEKNTFGINDWERFQFTKNYSEIYLCGVCTDICVISNAVLLKTAYPELEIYVIEDLCAGTTPEKHTAAIEVMKSLQINIINSKDCV